MEHQYRRGIYRPNAQRLSISLAPLVAQRSLMFRVKTDLAAKTSYAELSPSEESPALYTLTATASAQLISAALTAMSSASVYSQDSWKPNSAFVPLVVVDTRRHAIAFSPSVQWSDMSEEDASSGKYSLVISPPQSASVPQISVFMVNTDDQRGGSASETTSMHSLSLQHKVGPSMEDGLRTRLEKKQENGNSKLRKKTVADEGPKRASKSSKAFGRVISHLSLQPSKKELAQLRKATAAAALLSPEFKLPEFHVSPIRFSFIANANTVNLAVPPMPVPIARSFHPSTAILDTPEAAVNGRKPMEKVRQLRATMPPPPSTPAVVPPPARKGHRRYKSSPAVAEFSFRGWDKESMPPLPPMQPSSFKDTPPRCRHKSSPAVAEFSFRRWDTESMPPLPPMPPSSVKVGLPPRPRAKSLMSRPVRAITPPFPVNSSQQTRF
ncbi:hypothetical protein B0H34DRAFT_711953 [Crassisporium funariophilum]|nr:hypothetical protein B0H34DRAFT_711953 [Crassisporium funariophilum]